MMDSMFFQKGKKLLLKCVPPSLINALRHLNLNKMSCWMNLRTILCSLALVGIASTHIDT